MHTVSGFAQLTVYLPNPVTQVASDSNEVQMTSLILLRFGGPGSRPIDDR
jgi:hypothetical protein